MPQGDEPVTCKTFHEKEGKERDLKRAQWDQAEVIALS